MDAQQPNPDAWRHQRRIAAAWLAIVLAAGLWQCYGRRLLSSGGGDVF